MSQLFRYGPLTLNLRQVVGVFADTKSNPDFIATVFVIGGSVEYQADDEADLQRFRACLEFAVNGGSAAGYDEKIVAAAEEP